MVRQAAIRPHEESSMSETVTQLKELVEEHLARNVGKDAGLIALVGGLGAIARCLSTVQRGNGHWGPLVLELRQAAADTRAGLKAAGDDPGLERLRAFADRQLAFASALEDELVRIEEGESTLV
jgi:hypothetical protein